MDKIKVRTYGWMFSNLVFIVVSLILFAVMTEGTKWTNAEPIFFWVIGFLILFIFIIFASARAEVIEAIKVFWMQLMTQGRFVRIKFVMPDNKVRAMLLKVKGLVYDIPDIGTCFINPKLYVTEKGIKTFYCILGNAFMHNFSDNPETIIKKMYDEQDKLDKMIDVQGQRHVDFSDYIHNIYDEPYRIDMNLLKETLLNAQLAKKGLLEELLKLFKSRNLLIFVVVLAIASVVGAATSFMVLDHLKNTQLCQMGGAVINA